MSGLVVFLCLVFFSYATLITFCSSPVQRIAGEIEWRRTTRRELESGESSSCRTGNPIDDCWRCDSNWEANRKMLADCGAGFGRNAVGGRDGELYIVKDSNDDPENPVPGTLRHAVIQEVPLWIIFDHDMEIKLKEELVMSSYKTIDGRGFNIQISDGPCICIYNVSNIIIHNIYIHDCVPGGNAVVRDSPQHSGLRGKSDGDGISVFGARDIWIDHCTLASCYDGLIDVVFGSTAITISNNYMFHHNEVMLLGHSDDYLPDKNMQITIAFNFFGDGLVQRMPRCRHGYFHILNNIYTSWEMYAIGGSANPTINSQGNVTKHEITEEGEDWKQWNWRSEGDLLLNGAFFTTSGEEAPESYMKASSMVARPASVIINSPPTSGALYCQKDRPC
ncbi:hypothetical protein LWI29_022077 [Acer saccharum]|uniref:Pectate lyase n=1 Tax=Acer saccharum TaxID=4024 RepID=A0AA39VWE7_ACESA|nr:hypothetical protein LWI29_022077 [Acer saccharum]